MAHDHILDGLGVILDVAAANPGDFHLDQRSVFGNLRHVEFAIHRLVWAHLYGRWNFLNHLRSPRMIVWGLSTFAASACKLFRMSRKILCRNAHKPWQSVRRRAPM